MGSKEKKEGPLDGIQVLDLADEKASFCSRLLADLGARVIKIEKPGGDPSRRMGPFGGEQPGPERSLFFYYHNVNKMGVTLNLEHDEGKRLFLKLLKRTDVVVETFHPGYLGKIGLGFDRLSEKNPRLILVSVSGFGENGPRSQYKSCDLVASAFGGQMYVSGSPTSSPLKAFGEQSYYTASLFAAIGILLALRKRAQTGEGDHINVSLQESVVSTLDHVMVRYFYEQIVPRRQGSLYWNNSFCILSCKDGHLLMTPFQQWETLVEWLDSEGMAGDLKDERYREEEYRLGEIDHIINVLQRWAKTHTRHELFELGQLMRFPWAPIYSPKEVIANPQLKARRFFAEVSHPEMQTSLRCPGVPYRFSSFSLGRRKRAPLIGEDNVQIYQKELGLSDRKLRKLYSMGVI
jgi:benzylsuccinate CoA-transferase BbsE subunit